MTPQVVQKLEALHPPSAHPPPALPSTAPYVIFDSKAVSKLILRRRSSDAAPGLSGWTESLLLPLLGHKDILDALTTLLQDIAAGNLPDQARQLLLASSLVPTKKGEDGSGVRPIAVSETFVKLATIYLLDSLPANTVTDLLAPLQLGCGAPGGAEVAIHIAQANIITHPSHATLKLDLANGFNSMRRDWMLEQLFRHPALGHLWRIANWSYHKPSPLLVVSKGEVAAVLSSETGPKQGCALGCLLFCLGLQPLLTRAVGDVKVSCTAIVDDITVSGPASELSRFLHTFTTLLRFWPSTSPSPAS